MRRSQFSRLSLSRRHFPSWASKSFFIPNAIAHTPLSPFVANTQELCCIAAHTMRPPALPRARAAFARRVLCVFVFFVCSLLSRSGCRWRPRFLGPRYSRGSFDCYGRPCLAAVLDTHGLAAHHGSFSGSNAEGGDERPGACGWDGARRVCGFGRVTLLGLMRCECVQHHSFFFGCGLPC